MDPMSIYLGIVVSELRPIDVENVISPNLMQLYSHFYASCDVCFIGSYNFFVRPSHV